MLSGMLGRGRARESSERDRDRATQPFPDRPRPSIGSDVSAYSPNNGAIYGNAAANSSTTGVAAHPTSSHRRQDSLVSSASGSLRKKASAIGSPKNISGPITAPGAVSIAGPTSPPASTSSFSAAGPQAAGYSKSGEALLPEEMRAMQRQKEKQRESALTAEMSNQSIFSASSKNSTATEAGPSAAPTRNPYSSNHMESSTTRLLVATKMLLESLNQWSVGQKSETEVSDVYVRLGNDFYTARMAFGSYGIDMSDLASVPDDLRVCLEKCLSEEASPAVLDQFLPRVREIIVHLLQGLKLKQAEYKRILVSQQRTSSSSSSRRTSAMAPPSAPSRSSRIMRQERQGISESAGASAVPSEPLQPDADARPEMPQRAASSGTSKVTSPKKAAAAVSGNSSIQAPAPSVGEQPTSGAAGTSSPDTTKAPSDVQRHTLTDEPSPELGSAPSESSATLSHSQSHPFRMDASPRTQTVTRLNSTSGRLTKSNSARTAHDMNSGPMDVTEADPSLRALKSRDALERRASKRFSAYTFNKMGVGQGFGNGGLGMSSLLGMGHMTSPSLDRSAHHKRVSTKRAKPSISEVPSEERLRSPASSNSMRLSSDEVEDGQTPQASEAFPQNNLASTPVQTPQKHGGGLAPPGSRDFQPGSPSHPDIGSTDSLPFVDAQGRFSPTRSDVDECYSSIPPVPPLPTVEERAKLDAAQDQSLKHSRAFSAASGKTLGPSASSRTLSAASPTADIEIFLQIGRQTRKATLDRQTPVSVARLRMLFVDRFAYSPGKDDFPAIYIKDPANEVSYELEDLNDVTSGCLLTLNIEPLDQVKQHLDLSLGAISRELREVKAALHDRDQRDASLLAARRQSMSRADNSLLLPTASPGKFSDSQFAAAGQRVASIKRRPSAGPGPADGAPAKKQSSVAELSTMGEDDQAPGSPRSGAEIAAELKSHYDEVLSLRREMAILRQLQGDFTSDVGGLLRGMKEQSAKVRSIAAQEVPAERNFIIAGKSKLDTNSQEVLTLIEDLQDLVDDLKSDVLQRGVKPKPAVLKKVSADIERATKGLEELQNYVQTVKPSWKKTWEAELQNIVEEQDFLNHSEGLIADLLEDHTALQEVYEDIQQVVKLRSAGRPAGGKYIPPLPEEGHEGLSTVMLEVRGQNIDHERRLRALQAAEKNRQREMASRTNEFTDELAGFVQGKAGDGLRRTGGHLEAERIRAKRDKATLLAMFGAGGSGGAPPEVDLPVPKKLILGAKSDPAAQRKTSNSSGSQQQSPLVDAAASASDAGSGNASASGHSAYSGGSPHLTSPTA